jgi:hypothetical protein
MMNVVKPRVSGLMFFGTGILIFIIFTSIAVALDRDLKLNSSQEIIEE